MTSTHAVCAHPRLNGFVDSLTLRGVVAGNRVLARPSGSEMTHVGGTGHFLMVLGSFTLV